MKKRMIVAIFYGFLLSFLGMARGQSVNTDYDHGANFSNYHTYTWQEVKTTSSLWSDRIKNAVNQQLQAKGWQEVPSGGDVVLFAMSEVRNQTQEQTFYSGGGWYWGPGIATTSVYNTRVGSLVISMFDAKTKKLIWRGASSGDLSKNPDKNIGKLNKVVAKMFSKFPPKS